MGAMRCALLAALLQLARPLAVRGHSRCHRSCATNRVHSRMVEPPFPLPFDIPELPKPFSDYEWDDDYPGTLKPGKREEMYSLDDVFAMWEGKENPACIELRQDELWEVPTPPPEDILSWLERVGLLSDEEDEMDEVQEKELNAGSSLLEDEFDLEDGENDMESPELSLSDQILDTKESGATMSDFL
mmetsp:Transcript_18229/g.38884  ORF Transcript_18229/g.38884 Transcript_18229/m.38884 type:complete len:187 (-) Transcript_18229:263-823(-)